MVRTAGLLLAMHGVLRTGAAYLPLDPNYPPPRLLTMLEDARPAMVITDAAGDAVLPDGWVGVSFEELSVGAQRASSYAPPATLGDSALAYVLFTSGSTGRPKGAMITRKALANQLRWLAETYPTLPDDVVLQKTPFSFDASTRETLLPFVTGASVVVLPSGEERLPERVLDAVTRHRVTITQFVPTALRSVLSHPGAAEAFAGLRRVYCGGEVLSPDLARDFVSSCSAQLVNMYGPTETTVVVASHVCSSSHDCETVPVGRPVCNTRLHVLDQDRHPLPPGVAGELWVGGAQVGLGYVGQPELTAQRFVPDFIGQEPGSMLYRTGDRARLLPDGNFEVLGRLDRQIKLRGYRIELEELEVCLEQHPQVRKAACTVTNPGTETASLLACVVPETVTLDLRTLRDYLVGTVPDYMVPTHYALIESMPQLPNGKTDLRALEQVSAQVVTEPYLAPESPVEVALAEIWAELLGLDRVGANDDFFALGGHSILAIRLVSRVEAMYQVRLPVSAVFEAPTLAAQALVVEEAVLDDIEAMEDDSNG